MKYRPVVTGGILILVIVGLAATHYFIYRVGVHRGRSRSESWIYADRQPRNRWAELGQPFDHLFRRLGLDLGLMELLGAYPYHSQWGQDRWITERVFPGVKDGYFVDIGSGHGTKDSNTKVLEDLGWSGICVDPFPQNCAGSARTGERTLRVSVDAALRAGIFKASGSFDPMGWSVGARRSFPRP